MSNPAEPKYENVQARLSSAILFGGNAIVVPLTFLVSLVSNSINIYIFSRSMKNRQIVFLIGLAVADIYHLIYPMLFQFLNFGLSFYTRGRFYISLLMELPHGCKLLVFLRHSCVLLAYNMILACSVDRAIAIFFPIASRKLKKRHAWIAMFLVYCVSFVSVYPIVRFTSLVYFPQRNITVCYYSSAFYNFGSTYALLYTKSCLLQSAGIFFLNFILIGKVIRIQKRHLSLRGVSKDNHINKNLLRNTILNTWISNVFLLSAIPPACLLVGRTVFLKTNSSEFQAASIWQEILTLFVYIQSAVNWIIYLKRKPDYRAEAYKLFRGCHSIFDNFKSENETVDTN